MSKPKPLIKGIRYIKEETEESMNLRVNNPLGHNKHTDKKELVGKPVHRYKLMSKEDQLNELKRLNDEKRYFQSMAHSYAERFAFLLSVMGIERKKCESETRAEREFKEREG